MGASFLDEKRGIIKQLFTFYTSPSVPTIRIVMNGKIPVFELGKRARLRDNSLADAVDRKGWDITSSPIPMIHGKKMELGYITHPTGCTLDFIPEVKVLAADDDGNPIRLTIPKRDENGIPVTGPDGKIIMEDTGEYKYIQGNFEGTLGEGSDLDDFNESTQREQSRGWMVPFFIGIVAGVFFFAPMFAWMMSWVAQRAAGA